MDTNKLSEEEAEEYKELARIWNSTSKRARQFFLLMLMNGTSGEESGDKEE